MFFSLILNQFTLAASVVNVFIVEIGYTDLAKVLTVILYTKAAEIK